jgi:hypothetical protein
MPGIRFWFICLRAAVLAFAASLSTILVQLSGTGEAISGTTWLTAGLAAAVAAVNAGHSAWPADPPPP